MTRYTLTLKGSNPPQYYVSINAAGECLYSLSLSDADMFDSAQQAAIYCDHTTEEITPVDTLRVE